MSSPSSAGSTLSLSSQTTPTTNFSANGRRPLQREGARFFSLSDLEDAMIRDSPPPEPVLGSGLGKRIRQGNNGDNVEDGNETEPNEDAHAAVRHQPATPSLSNIAIASQRYAAKKKLRPEQRDEIDTFLLDTAIGRQAKLFALLLSLENKIDTQQSAAPPYALSEDLKTNINNYSLAVMLSVNISTYKGSVPTNHVLDILKRYRFDLPPGIEHDKANWEKITTYVSYSLMQVRSKMKKQIKASIETNANIFALAQTIVQGTQCRPSVALCARVALMRTTFLACEGGEKYWNVLDDRLKFIREKAGNSPQKMTRAFTGVLVRNRETFGVGEDYEIRDLVPDQWQQGVDEVVAGTVHLVAGTDAEAATQS